MKNTIALLSFLLTIGFGALLHSQAGGPMDKMSEKTLNTDSKSSAFQTIDGKLLKIDGEFYVLEDSEGKERRVHVNKETLLLNGRKELGDTLRAQITQNGHAISIQ